VGRDGGGGGRQTDRYAAGGVAESLEKREEKEEARGGGGLPDNAREIEKGGGRSSRINNYCYSVMTDVGHGKAR